MNKKQKVQYLSNTISEFLQADENLDFGEIYTAVFESLMEAERKEYLKYDRGKRIEKRQNKIVDKRNGYYIRSFDNFVEKLALRVPRVRLGNFKPLILEKLESNDSRINKLAFYLYVKGLSTRDINDVIEEMYGVEVSPQWVSNITVEYEEKRKEWQEREIESEYYVIYIDALNLNIRRDRVEKESVYIVLGLRRDLRREVLGFYLIPQESAQGWEGVLRHLKDRGLERVLLFVSDDLAGLGDRIKVEFPFSLHQLCVVHKERNVLIRVRVKDKREVAGDLKRVFDSQNPNHNQEEAESRLNGFIQKWERIYPGIGRHFEGREELFSYLKLPFPIWAMVYTTNWIERLNRSIRKVTKNKGSFPNPDSALNLVYMVIEEVEFKVYSHQITSLLCIQDELNDMLWQTTNPLDT
jgi:transposase-like protein